MKAAYVLDRSDPPRLILGDLPKPVPGSMEILIKVAAAGVTPTELQWSPTSHTKSGEPRQSAIPSHEFSGVVEALGSAVSGFSVGEEIYGMNDWYAQGATAEYTIASVATIAPKPRKLSLAESAVVPIGALTAWQGLFDRAHLQSGERVLVHGGAGAVGAFVIQLAKLHGADVIATASEANRHFVESLKADEVIDYTKFRFESATSNIDVIFDGVGGDTFERSLPLLNPGGRAITITAGSGSSPDPRVRQSFFIVEPNREQLMNIGLLIDGGSLRPFVGAAVPLSAAPAAYLGEVPRKDGRGKAVVVMPDFFS